ncbi:MAG: PLP-dependent cysteine synthase family protein [Gammaproteobacteria bacterium]|nr:PLP-dependent cysteine synthase family protein [Gammaproteobacteria bacterium]
MQTYKNILACIGNTPLFQVNEFDTGLCELCLKLELLNPGGSIKDRMGLAMIEGAELRGDIKPGDTIVEATAGNTGIALALIAPRKGYELVLVIPDKMSREKIDTLRAMGAEVVITGSGLAPDNPDYWHNRARTIADERNGYFINQFDNPDNARAHEETTGPEIWQQMNEQLDAVVVGAGSGGTVSGLSRYFAKAAPNVELIIADPEGSVVADYVNQHKSVSGGKWLVEGLGQDHLYPVTDLSYVKQAYKINDKDSYQMSRQLLLKEGLMTGSSTGCLLTAALRYCQAQTEPKRVVTFACDTGTRYTSKLYNDEWMKEQGFL